MEPGVEYQLFPQDAEHARLLLHAVNYEVFYRHDCVAISPGILGLNREELLWLLGEIRKTMKDVR